MNSKRLASFGQERLWFLHRMERESPVYNAAIGLRISGDVDPARLANCINQLIARHESLRTTFRFEDGHLHQIIAPSLRIEMTAEDCDLRRPFDLASGPLI